MYDNDMAVFTSVSKKLLELLTSPRFSPHIRPSEQGSVTLPCVPPDDPADDVSELSVDIVSPNRPTQMAYRFGSRSFVEDAWNAQYQFTVKFFPWLDIRTSGPEDCVLWIDIQLRLRFDEEIICLATELGDILSRYKVELELIFSQILGRGDEVSIQATVADSYFSKYLYFHGFHISLPAQVTFRRLSSRRSDALLAALAPWVSDLYNAEIVFFSFIESSLQWISQQSPGDPEPYLMRCLMLPHHDQTIRVVRSA